MGVLNQLRVKLKAGEFTIKELTQAVLKNIAADTTNAFIESFDKTALATAEALDKNGSTHLFKGFPVGIKDNMCLENHGVSCASAILKRL